MLIFQFLHFLLQSPKHGSLDKGLYSYKTNRRVLSMPKGPAFGKTQQYLQGD